MNALYDVNNDSSEDEEDKEDFILDGSSQNCDSSRRIVSVGEPYKLNTTRTTSDNTNVKVRSTFHQVPQKSPVTELKDVITKCALIGIRGGGTTTRLGHLF